MPVRPFALALVVAVGVTAPSIAPSPAPALTARTTPPAVEEGDDALRTVPLVVDGAPVAGTDLSGPTAMTGTEPLAGRLKEQGGAEAVLQRTVTTQGAPVVGLAWTPAADAAPHAEIRFRTAAGWDAWTPVEMTTEPAADDRSGEPLRPVMSEGMVAAGAEEVQVRLSGLDVAPVSDAEIVLVEDVAGPAWPGPGTSAGTPALATVPAGPRTATAAAPAVISRARWGADEVPPSPGCARPDYGTRLDRFVIHHTAGTNAYSAADSPAILRGIQRYHVQGRGWCDIGYNMLVDKFGQVFEGRRGGLEELVVGVHASGHNTNTVGLSVLGDYTKAAPSAASIDALVRVVGWKSYLHGIDPASSALKDGVMMRRVIGHREVASTSCPGAIQNFLGNIAARGRTAMLSYQPEFAQVAARTGTQRVAPAAVSAVVPVPASWTLTVTGQDGEVVARRSGDVHRRTTVVAEFAGQDEQLLPAGTYSARLDAVSTNGKRFTASVPVGLTYPPGTTLREPLRVLTVPGGTGGETREITTTALGLATDRTAAVLLRVCSSTAATTARLSPSDLAASMSLVVRTDVTRDGCGLALVGVGADDRVRVERPAGAGGFTVDLLGHLAAGAPATPFWDLGFSAFVPDVQWVAARRITTGNVDGTYRPLAPVSRQAMAAFLYRAAGSPEFTPPRTASFADVAPGNPFYREVEWLAASQIATGTDRGGGRVEFAPTEPVSRQAMAAFLYRAYGGTPTSVPTSLTDVTGTPFEVEIRWLAATGVTTGHGDGTFRPAAPVSRQAMAAFLHRADGLG